MCSTLTPAILTCVSSFRAKMVSRILLLLILPSSVWGTFELNETQRFGYEAVENQTVTLEWTFTVKKPIQNYNISCERIIGDTRSVVLRVEQGVQYPDSLHPDFKGRVQFDEDAFREGRLRVSVSGLQDKDFGQYRCKVATEYGTSTGKYRLRVTDSPVVVGLNWATVTAGDDVVLVCYLMPRFDATDLTVEWKQNESTVHVYRQRKDVFDLQDERFRGRTSMFHHELVKGNISLKLTNVTEEDAGRYTCHIPELKNPVKEGNFALGVYPRRDPGGGDKTPDAGQTRDKTGVIVGSVLGVLIFIIAASALIICCRKRGRTQGNKQDDQQRERPNTEEMNPLNKP